jgi:hypothetical protein
MTGLDTITVDLLLPILENLSTRNLLHIERTCKKIRDVAGRAYRASYGTQVCHRDAGHPPNFRCLAIEQLKHDIEQDRSRWQCTPEEAMENFLRDSYLDTEFQLRDLAADVLLSAGTGRDSPEWNEAVATALMAQARFKEAEAQYRKLMKSTALPERTILTAARFGWPFGFRYPDPTSRNLSEQAFLGASAAGNRDMLKNLNRCGIPWDVCLESQNAASVAARTGQVDILAYLREQGLDILASSGLQEAPLFHAITCGEVKAAQYLIQAGAPLIDDYLWHVAEGRNTNMTRYIISQRPDFVEACSSRGSLVVEHFFNSNISLENCENLLRLFFGLESFDINNKGHDGQSAIHLAAKTGRSDLCQLVVSLGADIKALDNGGMSVIDIASVGRHDELLRWLQEQTAVDLGHIIRQKSLHAERIIKGQRRLHMEILLAGDYANCFIGNTFNEKIESATSRWEDAEMDEKLTICWTNAHSAAALEEYTSTVLGSRTEKLLHQISLIINFALQGGTTTPELDDVQRANLPQARIVVSNINQTLFGGPSELRERVAKHVAHKITNSEIEEISGYLQSSLASMMRVGSEKKYMEQQNIFSRFLSLCA